MNPVGMALKGKRDVMFYYLIQATCVESFSVHNTRGYRCHAYGILMQPSLYYILPICHAYGIFIKMCHLRRWHV